MWREIWDSFEKNKYNALNTNFITVHNENTNNVQVYNNSKKNNVKVAILSHNSSFQKNSQITYWNCYWSFQPIFI